VAAQLESWSQRHETLAASVHRSAGRPPGRRALPLTMEGSDSRG
jgi:hypothetical protein